MSKLLKLIIIPAWIMAVSSAYAQEDYARDRSGAGAVPREPFWNFHSLGYILDVRPGRVGSELQRTDP